MLQKYLKYKNKYIELKKLIGGASPREKFEATLIKYINDETGTFLSTNMLPPELKWNWNEIKAEYLTSNPVIMRKFVEFREHIVDSTLKRIFDFFKCNGKCILKPGGSTGANTTLSSDLDYNLTAYIEGTYMVGIIIRIFISVLRDSNLGKNDKQLPSNASAYMFDTNIYAYGPIDPYDDNYKNTKIYKLVKTQYNGKWYYLPYNMNKKQDMWALSHLVKYIKHYNTYQFPFTLKSKKLKKFIKAEKVNVSMETNMEDYLTSINAYEELKTKLEDDMIVGLTPDMIKMQQNRLINILSRISSNAAEAYFTLGAFYHIVGTMFFFDTAKQKENQQLFADFLSEAALIHSIVDNFAFFVHAYIEHRDSILYPIKYLERILDGFRLLKLKKGNDIRAHPIFSIMKLLKLKIRNRNETEISENIAANRELTEFVGDGDVKQLIETNFKKMFLDFINEQLNKEQLEQFDKLIKGRSNIDTYFLSILYFLGLFCNPTNTSIRINITDSMSQDHQLEITTN